MKTKLIAFTTATAIAFSGITAAPAQAGPDEDLIRFLIGAAIVGVVINEANKNNQPVTVTTNNGHYKKKAKRKHHKKHHAHKKNKPRECLRQRWTNHGWKTFYGKRCMINHGWTRHDGLGWHKHRRHAHQ